MIREIMLGASLVMFAGAAPLAGDVNGQGQVRGDRGSRHERMADALGLTDGQRDQISSLRDRERGRGVELHERMKIAALDHRRLRDANDSRADQALAKLRLLREEKQARRLALRADIDQLLTPQQREKRQQMREKGRDRARNRQGVRHRDRN